MKKRTSTVLLLVILMVLSPALGTFAETGLTDSKTIDESQQEAIEEPAADAQQVEEAAETGETSEEASVLESLPAEKPVLKSPAQNSSGCEHNNTYVYIDTGDNVEYTNIEDDDIDHLVSGDVYSIECCEDCDQELSRTLLTEPALDAHDYRDGVCTLCGHVNTCTHDETYKETDFGDEIECEDIGDASVHLVTGDVYEVEYCEECGEELSRVKIDKAKEEHYFENGVCIDCGYQSKWSLDGKYYYDNNGKPVKGWKQICGERYYFDPSTGIKKTGWLKSGSDWYYLDTAVSEKTGVNGAMATGRKKLGDKYYFFNESTGIMKTGWREDTYSDWYYYNSSGAQIFGWQKIKNVWYYFEEDDDEGCMATGPWYVTKANKTYLFDDNGKWLQKYGGWYSDKWDDEDGERYEDWYYFKAGTAVKGWQKISGTWYYFDPDIYSTMVANGWAKDSKGWCWMGSNGKMVKNKWIRDNGDWYFMDSSGHMTVNKWRKDSKGWCWLQANGKMLTNGWAKDSKGWCWIADNGYMLEVTKWIDYDGDKYYITKGYRVENRNMNIGGKSYAFDKDGRCLNYY